MILCQAPVNYCNTTPPFCQKTMGTEFKMKRKTANIDCRKKAQAHSELMQILRPKKETLKDHANGRAALQNNTDRADVKARTIQPLLSHCSVLSGQGNQTCMN